MMIIIILLIIIIKIPGLHPAGYSQVLRADEAFFSLGWQSYRDGASIKIPVFVQPKIH